MTLEDADDKTKKKKVKANKPKGAPKPKPRKGRTQTRLKRMSPTAARASRACCCLCCGVFTLLLLIIVVQYKYQSRFARGTPLCVEENGTIRPTNPSEAIFGPFDLVFTWVNGSDPGFLSSWRNFGKTMGRGRFRDYGTLMYALRSVEQYAPFFNHIYIVTNGQVPNWLNLNNPKVSIVSHEDIFEDRGDLPNFNSHSIESSLHRIPGLKERFVYCNDDMMFGNRIDPTDFWEEPDKTAIYYSWRKIPGAHEVTQNGWKRSLQHCNDVLNADPDIPFEETRHYPTHHCYNFRKSILAEMSWRYRDEYVATRSRKFRNVDDVTIPFLYMNFVPYSGRPYVVKKSDFVYCEVSNDMDRMHRMFKKADRKPKYLCFNDAYHDMEPDPKSEEFVRKWFEKKFPNPSSFEKIKSR